MAISSWFRVNVVPVHLMLNWFTVRFRIGFWLVRDLFRVDLWFIEDWFNV